MLWIHPVLQTLAFLLSFSVLYLGWLRFQNSHLGRKALFPWKGHVRQGLAVMGVWCLGFVIGLGAAWESWHIVLVTGWHHRLALIMIPFLAFGLASGWVMDKRKKKRRWLPLLHGINNTLLVAATAVQLCTGVLVIRDFMLP
jgi:hypothetical protein